jgi:hypothetical protein
VKDFDRELGREEDVVRVLDEAAAREESNLRAALALDEAPGLGAVPRVLEDLWRTEARVRPRRRVQGAWLVAAAAAVVLALVWLRGRDDASGAGPSGRYLSDSAFAIVEPGAHAEHWSRIVWSGPADGRYRVRVRDARDATTVLGWTDVRGANELVLPDGGTADWPTQIRIEIELRGADGSWTRAEPRESELRR